MAWIDVVAKNVRYTTPVSAGGALGSDKLRVHRVGNNTSARRMDVVTNTHFPRAVVWTKIVVSWGHIRIARDRDAKRDCEARQTRFPGPDVANQTHRGVATGISPLKSAPSSVFGVVAQTQGREARADGEKDHPNRGLEFPARAPQRLVSRSNPRRKAQTLSGRFRGFNLGSMA